jgi:hypothetical protein
MMNYYKLFQQKEIWVDRFISLDEETSELYPSKVLELKEVIYKFTDNFGFIFISSKCKNYIWTMTDFFNRVDLVEITRI